MFRTAMTQAHKPNHFLTLKTLPPATILSLVHRSLAFKHAHPHTPPASNTNMLHGKTLALLFTKKSTRTRISAETAWSSLGGHPMFLGANDIQLGDPAKGGESWRDTATVVGSMVDAVFARLGDHKEIEELAQYSRAPVINALTAKYHPMQALADIMTIYEATLGERVLKEIVSSGEDLPRLEGVKVAWVGDANNIINSLLVSLPRLGIHVSVATPAGYEIDADIKEFVAVEGARAKNVAGDTYGTVSYTTDPSVACNGAHIIVTDTWVSMGQEADKESKLKDFAGYKVTEAMAKLGNAHPDWKFMHCLPRKLEEVDDEVFYNPDRSLVFSEAENRKWTAIAVFEHVMGGK
ncbi:ornithine carbamoyltransferase [Chytriomyces hyalinus]|nr:ornithine carbamoyltransferase [Chytriomyces hyalinus]